MIASFLLAVSLCPAWASGPAPLSDAQFSSAFKAVLQETKVSAMSLAAAIDHDDLLDLLKDRDPAVRKEALRTARFQQGINSDVRERVFAMAGDTSEDTGVRREAVRTMFWATNFNETRDKLLDLARRDRSLPVRAMAYKALYQSAFTFSEIRDAVRDAAQDEREPTVRAAAIWALFDCTGNSEILDTLMDIAKSYREDAAMRAEAVKSLFLAMNRSQVKDLVLGLAKDRGLDQDLRVPAVYALYGARNQWEVQDALKDMSRESDPDIRVAAIKALGNDDLFMRAYFHIGTHVNGHVYVSPIENE
ncbi:MAG: HEAT repeat domain-containing protein [Elusimicrobia bacterium]|nr:HEAT repeat domain-containing protein [Elusimicrobiota bacterium]